MQVQRVEVPGSRVESWTVLGDDGVPIGPVERYLAYLTAVERSPNTVRAYAHDLKDYFVFLDHRGLDWREVRLEDLGGYVGWLALPSAGRAGQVAVLPSAGPQVGAASVNRKLSALSAFYAHQVRHGVDVGELLITWQAGGRRNGGVQELPAPRGEGQAAGPADHRVEGAEEGAAGGDGGGDAGDPGRV